MSVAKNFARNHDELAEGEEREAGVQEHRSQDLEPQGWKRLVGSDREDHERWK